MGTEVCKWCGAEPGECDCAERIHCPDAGKIGHQSCGMCERHNVPQFWCGCRIRRDPLPKDYDFGRKPNGSTATNAIYTKG